MTFVILGWVGQLTNILSLHAALIFFGSVVIDEKMQDSMNFMNSISSIWIISIDSHKI